MASICPVFVSGSAEVAAYLGRIRLRCVTWCFVNKQGMRLGLIVWTGGQLITVRGGLQFNT